LYPPGNNNKLKAAQFSFSSKFLFAVVQRSNSQLKADDHSFSLF